MSDKKKLLVVIDPGHTGNTYNAGAVKGYYESKAVYDLSLYEKAALEKRGIRCHHHSLRPSAIIGKTGRQDDRCHCQGHEAIHRHHL